MFVIELETLFHTDGAAQTFAFELDLQDLAFNGGFPFTEKIRIEGSVQNNAGIVTLRAAAAFTLLLQCDRCADTFSRSFRIPVEHTLVTKVEDETNDELIVIDDFHYDLEPLLREDVILSLPTKVLCREDCKGICMQCGKNLNQGSCECKKATDPRWDALSFWNDTDDETQNH